MPFVSKCLSDKSPTANESVFASGYVNSLQSDNNNCSCGLKIISGPLSSKVNIGYQGCVGQHAVTMTPLILSVLNFFKIGKIKANGRKAYNFSLVHDVVKGSTLHTYLENESKIY